MRNDIADDEMQIKFISEWVLRREYKRSCKEKAKAARQEARRWRKETRKREYLS